MKLKCQPADFTVDELTEFACGGGPFAFYRLRKQSLGTPEAIDAILRRWKLQRRQVSYGGLKDKYAATVQHLTILHGPRRGLRQTNLELTYLGQAPRPFTPHHIAGNRFQIVVRDLTARDVRGAEDALRDVKRCGVPNYFDDQRFGSLGKSGEFAALPWCRGDYARALWLMLADANEHDVPDERKAKAVLRAHWGQWAELKSMLPRSHARSIVSYLADHPADFRGAVARVRVDLRGLYLAAFQSYLWNRVLSLWLQKQLPGGSLWHMPLGPDQVVIYRSLPDDALPNLLAMQLPLPSARQKVEEPLAGLYAEALAPLGLEMRILRVKYPRDSFFSRGHRAAICQPRDLQAASRPDELYPGKLQWKLEFELPRGAYATIVIKRFFQLADAGRQGI